MPWRWSKLAKTLGRRLRTRRDADNYIMTAADEGVEEECDIGDESRAFILSSIFPGVPVDYMMSFQRYFHGRPPLWVVGYWRRASRSGDLSVLPSLVNIRFLCLVLFLLVVLCLMFILYSMHIAQ